MQSDVLEASVINTVAQESPMKAEVRRGLLSSPKRLPSKFFYDARGSQLFEEICSQPEYYLTRVELQIMRSNAPQMARELGDRVRLVEFGSGSGSKTKILLENLRMPAAYVPVEISKSALEASVDSLQRALPQLEILPLVADFTKPLRLPNPSVLVHRTVVYFPGSTLGNFDSAEALQILRNIRTDVGPNGGALIGIDLRKDVAQMEAAYNDQAGVTAAFTLNMLSHLNHAVGTDFDLAQYEHHAHYDTVNGRIETNIISLIDQVVMLNDDAIRFKRGERMLVEYSHKYSMREFAELARHANFRVTNTWTDDHNRFAVLLLTAAKPAGQVP